MVMKKSKYVLISKLKAYVNSKLTSLNSRQAERQNLQLYRATVFT